MLRLSENRFSDLWTNPDGRVWKPLPGATASGEEFGAAHELFVRVTKQSSWNPWVRDELAAEYEQAIDVIGQWVPADPGHRYLTDEEMEARLAERRRDYDRAEEERRRRQAKAKQRYDPAREQARYALLEHRAHSSRRGPNWPR